MVQKEKTTAYIEQIKRDDDINFSIKDEYIYIVEFIFYSNKRDTKLIHLNQ